MLPFLNLINYYFQRFLCMLIKWQSEDTWIVGYVFVMTIKLNLRFEEHGQIIVWTLLISFIFDLLFI